MTRSELDRRLEALRSDISGFAKAIDSLLDRVLSAIASGDPYDARIAQSQERTINAFSENIEEYTIDILTQQQPVLATDLRFVVGALIVTQRLQRLGNNVLGTARLAIDLAALEGKETAPEALLSIGNDARSMLTDAVAAFINDDTALSAQIVQRDESLDQRYRTLREDLLAALSANGLHDLPDENHQRRMTYWLWIAHKMERIADHAVVIAKRTQQIH